MKQFIVDCDSLRSQDIEVSTIDGIQGREKSTAIGTHQVKYMQVEQKGVINGREEIRELKIAMLAIKPLKLMRRAGKISVISITQPTRKGSTRRLIVSQTILLYIKRLLIKKISTMEAKLP